VLSFAVELSVSGKKFVHSRPDSRARAFAGRGKTIDSTEYKRGTSCAEAHKVSKRRHSRAHITAQEGDGLRLTSCDACERGPSARRVSTARLLRELNDLGPERTHRRPANRLDDLLAVRADDEGATLSRDSQAVARLALDHRAQGELALAPTQAHAALMHLKKVAVSSRREACGEACDARSTACDRTPNS